VARFEKRDLLLLRLLDLHDHIGGGKNLGSAVGDHGSRLAVGLIRRSDSCARVRLDDDAVTCSHIFANRAWCQANAILLGLNLLWHTDAHRWALLLKLSLSNIGLI
jgi:hypothetical protein